MPPEQHKSASPIPVTLTVHQQSCVLETIYEDGKSYRLPFEFLRVYSPSAEVQGHGPGQEILQTGKRKVTMTALDQVGNYGVKPQFSDGHESGIYTWDYLFWLGSNMDELWQDYLTQLTAAGFTPEGGRDAPMSDRGTNAHGCSS